LGHICSALSIFFLSININTQMSICLVTIV
jgi:hypothetical protein